VGRFDFDYRGVGEYMRTDPDLARAVFERATLAHAFAKSIAPVGTPAEHDHHPGHYRESLTLRGPVMSKDRPGYVIETDAVYAPAVEAEHHVLKKTIAAFGDPKGGAGL